MAQGIEAEKLGKIRLDIGVKIREKMVGKMGENSSG